MNVATRANAVRRSLGLRIQKLRVAKGWSQAALGHEAAMHRTYIWGIEHGVRNPSLTHLVRIADALRVSISTLFKGV
jgi:transcriptional regulator with XRE-family HTH domain